MRPIAAISYGKSGGWLRTHNLVLPTVRLGLALALVGGLPNALASTPDIVLLTNAHVGNMLSVAFSRDGQTLASGSEDRRANVWTVPGGSLVRTVTTPGAWMMSVAVYPPADYLLTGGDDGAARMWSISSGGLLCGASPNNNIVWSVAISGNGASVAVGKSNPGIEVGNASCVPGGRLLEGHEADVVSVVFSPDATLLASGSWDGTAKIWRVADGALLRDITGHSVIDTNGDFEVRNKVYAVDFSPDGMLLLTSSEDGTARLWRVSDGQSVRVIEGGGGSAAKFSADGKTLYTLNNGIIKFWRVSTGALLDTFENTGATCLAVSPDGKYYAYGRGDGALVLARVPLWIETVTQSAGEIILRWQGGSGLYQSQQRTNLTSGTWENVGSPTVATALTNAVSASPVFYRVQSLPNP